jgi:hypothetical protein
MAAASGANGKRIIDDLLARLAWLRPTLPIRPRRHS